MKTSAEIYGNGTVYFCQGHNADLHPRVREIPESIARANPGADLCEMAGNSPELADMGLSLAQARAAATRFLKRT